MLLPLISSACILFDMLSQLLNVAMDLWGFKADFPQNHLIETASTSTGSLIIWDIGDYEVLPYYDSSGKETDDELSYSSDGGMVPSPRLSETDKLHSAFHNVRARSFWSPSFDPLIPYI